MLKPAIKRIAIFSMLLYIFLIKTSYTSADIFADRVVSNNRFVATSVDFSTRNTFNNGVITSLFHIQGLQPSGYDMGATKVMPETSTKFKYRLKVQRINGDELLCNRLQAHVLRRNFSEMYNGSLMDMSITSNFVNSEPRDFIFVVGLEDEDRSLKNKICEFQLDFRTYRESPDENGGIYAQRLISNVVSSGNW